jgi:hypothetical protein
LVDDFLGGCNGTPIEAGDTRGRALDKRVQLSIGYRTVDPTVAFGCIRVEILAAGDDFDSTGSSLRNPRP